MLQERKANAKERREEHDAYEHHPRNVRFIDVVGAAEKTQRTGQHDPPSSDGKSTADRPRVAGKSRVHGAQVVREHSSVRTTPVAVRFLVYVAEIAADHIELLGIEARDSHAGSNTLSRRIECDARAGSLGQVVG